MLLFPESDTCSLPSPVQILASIAASIQSVSSVSSTVSLVGIVVVDVVTCNSIPLSLGRSVLA